MKTKRIIFEVDTFSHLIPVIELARTAMLAERSLRDLEAVRRLYPDIDQALANTGVNVLDDETITEHASHALEFVVQVLRRAHQQSVRDCTNDL